MKWIKYPLIIVYSMLTGSTVVDLFGSTYAVAGMSVIKIR